MFFPLAHVVELDDKSDFRWRFIALILAGFLLIAYWQEWVKSPFQWDLAIALTFIFGYRTFTKAFRDLSERRVSADQAVVVAALAALYVGEYLAAAEVVYIMLVGETLEEYTARRFRSDLKKLLSCIPHHTRVIRDDNEVQVHVEDVIAGDSVIVYPGERIPVDGQILDGESLIDESSITGESVPRERIQGEKVHAGTLNESGRLLIEANRVGESTVLNRIVQLVEEAKERKAPIQRTADRYAKWFLPFVLAIAVICYLFSGDIMRSVAVLIVACPCAMVLATPAAVLASVSSLARRGVVVKGGIQIETLANVDCFAFDKTGTLTRGKPELTQVISYGGTTENEILSWAASLESHSEHLLATAIRKGAKQRSAVLYNVRKAERFSGLGMEGTLDEDGEQETHSATNSKVRILVGSSRFLENRGCELSAEIVDRIAELNSEGSISVLVARNLEVVGILVLKDAPRTEAEKTVRQLQEIGIRKSLLLTGDNSRTAEEVARMIGISDIRANLLPEEKLECLADIKSSGFTVAMVGDGVNDSPSLAAADVGIAMGDTGTDIAAEAAGVVLLGDEALSRIPDLVRTSRRTVKTIQDNIFWFGFVINVVAVIAAFVGYLSAIAAAVVHQIASFLVLMSSLRLLKSGSSFKGLGNPMSLVRMTLPEFSPQSLRSSFVSSWINQHGKTLRRSLLWGGFALYMLSGLAFVAPDEQAVVTRFGRAIGTTLPPGMHYRLPWLLESVHRVRQYRINSIEIGFRTGQTSAEGAEPPAYEWNIQHREGRYIREPTESQMLTGDEYLLDVNAVIQYSIENPEHFLFRSFEIERTLEAIAEGTLRKAMARTSSDEAMISQRAELEQWTLQGIRDKAGPLRLGLKILSVDLQDVHPALEAVDAFREVASAMEEKEQLINEAQGYANERLPLSRGESEKRLINARAYSQKRKNYSIGESQRFTDRVSAYRNWQRPTALRLYLETVEEVLSDKKKYILDATSGRRKILLLRDSIFRFSELQQRMERMGLGDTDTTTEPEQYQPQEE